MWAVGDSELPGPVAGYLRLLKQLPADKRAIEFSRIPGRAKTFQEGLYRFQYYLDAMGERDSGRAMCVLLNGKIFGCDPWGGEIHGCYKFRASDEKTHMQVVLKVPPGGMLITGLEAGEDCAEFEISGSFERADPETRVIVKVAGVPVEVVLSYIGPLPR